MFKRFARKTYCWRCGATPRVRCMDSMLRYERCPDCSQIFCLHRERKPEHILEEITIDKDTKFKRLFGFSPQSIILEVFLENPEGHIDISCIADDTGLPYREVFTILDSLFRAGILGIKRDHTNRLFYLSKDNIVASRLFIMYSELVGDMTIATRKYEKKKI